ncbi:PorP/SprF family type IX secretion system membrane protein [Litoribaculum gwangyangense]|uniref:Type IX secretion system membrane protein PorP/SprF n=1 Tax=Litoribaculum gwangyangense TaxID=1130722 RepID=A0ABP9CF80_9FLAO
MQKQLLYIVLFFITIQQFHAQEDGVVALNLPVRNSLKFNRYAINPTFSFVREQNKYITFTNKREWVQFDNAPQTYLFSYSGRFRENIGIGIGLFQQNYGVLTTFGGTGNFAYNVTIDSDKNLTFGTNLSFYNSGINEGNVITNFPDPSLQNLPSNSILTINPGINYGTEFFDFGVSINNLATYNLTNSTLIDENPEQSLQGHIMYTGYMNSRGFFDESKFTGLVRSEFKKEQTVVSGLVMLMVPKGIWAQAGYNSLYGVSGGIGLNITSQIAMEYNFEKAIGDLSSFGNSHEITLAYKFNNTERYRYSGDDDEEAFVIQERKSKRKVLNKKPVNRTKTNSKVNDRGVKQINTDEQTRIAQQESEAKRLATEQQQAKLEAEEKAKEEAKKIEEEKNEKALVEERARIEQEKLAAENKAKEEAQAKRLIEEQSRIALEQEETRLEAEKKAQEEAKAKELADVQARNEKEKLAAENKAKEDAEAIRLIEEQSRVAQEQEQARLEAEKKAEEKAKAKELAEEQTRMALELEQAKIAEEKRLEKEQAIAETQEQARLEKERLQAQQKMDTVQLEGVMVPIARDREALAMQSLTKLTENSRIEQQDLLKRLQETVDNRQQDLDDLKEENDLSEQGIYKTPKAFKSISAENAALESLKIEIDDIIKTQNDKISELERLYNERLKTVPSEEEEVNAYYLDAIQNLKTEQAQALRTKESLLTSLEDIKEATEFERKRRIKRAAYDNEEVRYNKDRSALNVIKQNTQASSIPLEVDDFDFGEERSNNIEIVKNITNTEDGYYLVLAVHDEISKRDDFLTKVISAGEKDIDFFFDVNTNKYYIYSQKVDDVQTATRLMQSKGNEPYSSKMTIVKIEN